MLLAGTSGWGLGFLALLPRLGGPAKPAPALTREPQAAPDSSDEEEDRLLQLGAEGK